MPLAVLNATDAIANLRGRTIRWPDGRNNNQGRLGLRAKVETKPKFHFTPEDTILTIGSCFAREIERCLQGLGFDVPLAKISLPRDERTSETANDIINKYVPHAMANELRWMLDSAQPFPEDAYLQLSETDWHDPHLGANISPAPLARVKERRQEVFNAYQKARNARVVVVTLGLVEAWFDKKLGVYLNAAPPMKAIALYPDRFDFHLLAYEEIIESLNDILQILTDHGHPDFRMVLTVSPVPFKATFTGRDALMANTYSKSVLRAAAEAFSRLHDNVDYFPSYEIVTLSDRAAAFHMDNIHVRAELVKTIMDQVVKQYTGLAVTSLPESASVHVEKPKELNALSMYQYARELSRHGEYQTASQVMRSIEETFGSSSCGIPPQEFYLNFGIWLLRAKYPTEGEAEVRKSIAIDATNPRAHYKHGLALARLKKHEQAVEAFRKSIELAPAVADYRWRIGLEFSRMNRKQEAIAALNDALTLMPGHALATKALARLTEAPAGT